MNVKKALIGWISEKTELHSESIPGIPLVEICGMNRVAVENHQGIFRYTTSQIGVQTKSGTIIISGSMLRIHRITRYYMVIVGNIQCVSLGKEDGT